MHTDNLDFFTFQPLSPQLWLDFECLFNQHGVQNGCWCMYWRITRREFSGQFGDKNKQAFKQIVDSGLTPGILAYKQSQPIGWCSIAPRIEFGSLNRSHTLKPVDDLKIWSIVCFFIDKSYRNQGLNEKLILAAISYACEKGAKIVEAYPLVPKHTAGEEPRRYMGVLSSYLKLGFVEAAHRSPARVIVRYSIPD